MIKKVFLDSDIILDVATGRMPFVEHSTSVLASIENGKVLGYISSNNVKDYKKSKLDIYNPEEFLALLGTVHIR